MSPKSKVVASRASLAQQVEAALGLRGIRSIRAALRTTGLGLDVAGGLRLTKPKHGARKRAAGTRVGNYMRLRSAGGATAAKLYRTGAFPKYSYGCKAYGAHPAVVEQARRALGALITGAKAGRCLTTALCVEQPRGQDPAITLRVAFIQQWLEVWAKCKDLRVRIIRAWPLAEAALESGSRRSRWRRSAGALSGIILTLSDIGWKLVSVLEWHTDLGEVWTLPGGEEEAEELDHIASVLGDVRRSILRQLWARAASHRLGQGLEQGFVQEQPRLRLKQLGAKGDFARRGALQLILAGGMWPRLRRKEAGLSPSATCHRCGASDDDEYVPLHLGLPKERGAGLREVQAPGEEGWEGAPTEPCLLAEGADPREHAGALGTPPASQLSL